VARINGTLCEKPMYFYDKISGGCVYCIRMGRILTVTCTVIYIAIASRFSHDSDSDCRREVAVNDGQYLKLPATFHLFFFRQVKGVV